MSKGFTDMLFEEVADFNKTTKVSRAPTTFKDALYMHAGTPVFNSWGVYEYGNLIDTVYYRPSFTSDMVLDDLTTNCGYPSWVEVMVLDD